MAQALCYGAGGRLRIASTLHNGAEVGRFVVLDLLGRGSNASVYLVRDGRDGSTRALKLLDYMSEARIRRLMVEGELQVALRHPNVVEVYETLSEGDHLGLVMEFIDGPTLAEMLARRSLTVEESDRLAQGILRGVRAVHRRGAIHRDLKPSNILLQRTESGLVPKVADFGLAKALRQDDFRGSITQSGQMMGSPPYMSPEQIRASKHVDARADVFSLGIILYQMATGERPFQREDVLELFACISEGVYTPPRERVPELPDRMVSAIHGALMADVDARIQSTEELLDVWLARTEGPADTCAPYDPDEDMDASLEAEPDLPPPARVWIIGAGLIGLAVVVAVTVFLLVL